jgi:hypothetical protein
MRKNLMNRLNPKGKEVKTMKKIAFLTSMLIALLVFAGVSQAIIINSGPFGGKYTDNSYADFDYLSGNLGPAVAAPGQDVINGQYNTTPTGNIWGIVSLTGIHTLLDNNPENNNLSGAAYYAAGSDNKYYFGVYGGLTYMSGSAPGEVRLGAASGITPYLKIYEVGAADIGAYDAAATSGPNVPGAGAFGSFATDIINAPTAVLWLDTTFSANTLAAYDLGFQAGELELVKYGTTQTGDAEAYLDILGGTGASLFETGVFDLANLLIGTDRADLKIISDLTANFNGVSNTWTNPFGWTTNSQDPVTGVGSTIPEPSTIILLGAGLFGIGIFGRKKLKK